MLMVDEDGWASVILWDQEIILRLSYLAEMIMRGYRLTDSNKASALQEIGGSNSRIDLLSKGLNAIIRVYDKHYGYLL